MQHALKIVPVSGIAIPSSIVFERTYSFYQEFTHSSGIPILGIVGKPHDGDPPAADAEKKKILDLFKE